MTIDGLKDVLASAAHRAAPWLRKNSSLARRISPYGADAVSCDSCHGVDLSVRSDTLYTVRHVAKHLIGEVWIGGRRFNKWCDGSEV